MTTELNHNGGATPASPAVKLDARFDREAALFAGHAWLIIRVRAQAQATPDRRR